MMFLSTLLLNSQSKVKHVPSTSFLSLSLSSLSPILPLALLLQSRGFDLVVAVVVKNVHSAALVETSATCL